MSMFHSEKIAQGTWKISGEGCDAYLLEGGREAVMIDAGMWSADILEFIADLTDMPVRGVINTHSHFDHTAGNGYFSRVYATEGIARSAKNTMGGAPEDFPLDYSFTIVKDGDIIDLGDRPLEVILLDAHSPGCVAVLDETYRLLYPGDELEKGQVLLLPGYAEEPGQIHARPASTVQTYQRAIRRLNGYRDRFDKLCPAHNGSPIGADYIDRYIELAQKIMDGYEGSTDCSGATYTDKMGHFPRKEANYRRAEWNGASLIYCADRILDTDGEQVSPATVLHEQSAHSIY